MNRLKFFGNRQATIQQVSDPVPQDDGVEQHHGGRNRRCASRLDRSACSAALPGAGFDVGSSEMSKFSLAMLMAAQKFK
jgi:hypothetical protein